MAVWIKLDSSYSWSTISEVTRTRKLEIGDCQCYNCDKLEHNYIRIGFAAYNEEEIYELISRLKKTIDEIEN